MSRAARRRAVNRMQLFRGSAWSRPVVAAGLLGLCASLEACQSPPLEPESASRVVAREANGESFSRDRAWRHLLALADLGPRVAGTEGAAQARGYIRARLEELGLDVLERRSQVFVEADDEAVELVHVTGVIPGKSSDVFMLVASYDTPPRAKAEFERAHNEGASGPALLLELARVLASQPQPYTVSVAFLEGEAFPPSLRDGEAALLGSRDLARQLAEEGSLSRLRLAVFFHHVADPDLEIARDLRSHQVYREIFWQAAQSLGHVTAFPSDGGFRSPRLGHLSFLDRGLRGVVAIADDRLNGEDAPGARWCTDRDPARRCSAESLEVVAVVTLEALEQIGARLEKIDRFASSPLDHPARGAPEPRPSEHVEEADPIDGEPGAGMHSEAKPVPAASQPPASP
jgi:hypothetical protein